MPDQPFGLQTIVLASCLSSYLSMFTETMFDCNLLMSLKDQPNFRVVKLHIKLWRRNGDTRLG